MLCPEGLHRHKKTVQIKLTLGSQNSIFCPSPYLVILLFADVHLMTLRWLNIGTLRQSRMIWNSIEKNALLKDWESIKQSQLEMLCFWALFAHRVKSKNYI